METFIFGQWWRNNQSLAWKCTYFQILCCVLEKWIRTQHQILFGKNIWFGSKSSSQYKTSDTIDGEPMKFEWNISQDSRHCSSSTESMSSWPEWAIHHNSKDELNSNRCSMTSDDNDRECNANSNLVSFWQKDSQQDYGHSQEENKQHSSHFRKIGVCLHHQPFKP